jgi:heme oxygenase
MSKLLWEKTRDLHHACEAHKVGAAMSRGTPPIQWYSDWVYSLLVIHAFIDQHMPESTHRTEKLKQDLLELPNANYIKAAHAYVDTLSTKDENYIQGVGYVLLGAHLMGGEIMRRRLENYPTNHLTWDDRKSALDVLTNLRNREESVDGAKSCFYALLSCMDEILTY